jgi:hypothetical protein
MKLSGAIHSQVTLVMTRFIKVFVLLSALLACPAQAHVKWFVDVHPSDAPRPIGDVLTEKIFVNLFLLSVFAIYAFFWVDRWALRKALLAQLDERMKRFDISAIYVMRISVAIFFLTLGSWHWIFGSSFFLTPELRTNAFWVPWLELALGVFALSSRTTALTGAGVLVLYLAAVVEYGIYHLTDYMIFLGIAYFLLVSGIPSGGWRKSGFIVLYASTGLTLTWGAIEKFAYPFWTYDILRANPGMLMGLKPHTFMIVSGFVEFNLAFVLLGAASMIGRLVALGLWSVFVLAIFQFGLTDAIGHLMFIAILFVLFFRGPTDARNMLVLPTKTLWVEAYFMTGLYTFAFIMICLAYYGLHHVYYGA